MIVEYIKTLSLQDRAHLRKICGAQRDCSHGAIEWNTKSLSNADDVSFARLLKSVAARDDAHIMPART